MTPPTGSSTERDEWLFPDLIWLVVGKRKLRETGIPRLNCEQWIEVIIDTVNSVDINQNIVVYNGTVLPTITWC